MYPPRTWEKEQEDRRPSTSAWSRPPDRAGRVDDRGYPPRERSASPRRGVAGPSTYAGGGSNYQKTSDFATRTSDTSFRNTQPVGVSRSRDNSRPGYASPEKTYPTEYGEIRGPPGTGRYERRSESVTSKDQGRDGPPREPARDRRRDESRDAVSSWKDRTKEGASREERRDSVMRDGGAKDLRTRDVQMRDVSMTPTTAEGLGFGLGQGETAAQKFVRYLNMTQRAMDALMRARDGHKQFETLLSQCPDDPARRAELDKKIQARKDEVDKAQARLSKLADVTAAAQRQCVHEVVREVLDSTGWKERRPDAEGSTSAGTTNGKSTADHVPMQVDAPVVPLPAAPAAGPVTNGPVPVAANPTETSAAPAAADPVSPGTKNRKLKKHVANEIDSLKVDVDNLATQVYWVEDSGNDQLQTLRDDMKALKEHFTEETVDLRKTLGKERKARQRDRTNSEQRDAANTTEIQALHAKILQMEQKMTEREGTRQEEQKVLRAVMTHLQNVQRNGAARAGAPPPPGPATT